MNDLSLELMSIMDIKMIDTSSGHVPLLIICMHPFQSGISGFRSHAVFQSLSNRRVKSLKSQVGRLRKTIEAIELFLSFFQSRFY